MKKRRTYKEAIQMDLDKIKINLIPTADSSSSSVQRTQEILDTVAKVIYLASKRGPVKKRDSEGEKYAA